MSNSNDIRSNYMISIRRRLTHIAIWGITLLATAAPSHAEMGRTPGKWAVSPAGAATYSIPIWTPQGPRGLQPSMAFVYNSQAGNGPLGVGWSVSGFSSIDRCAWSSAEDGQDGAVTMSASDRFCLNGNKLRIVSGPLSSYGTAGAVYQTQIADFSRITSVGTVASGSGPQSFLVHTKSGLILEYGNTTSSRITMGDWTVYSWMLNKVTDQNGNSYEITYTTNTESGRLPLTVSWGRTSAGVYQYQATFNYSIKPNSKDHTTVNQGSSAIISKMRLDSLTIGYSASGGSYATQRQYVMQYTPGPATQFSRLTQIKECGASTSTCLNPTNIGYQDGLAGVNSSGNSAIGTSSNAIRGKFDFNGDGRTDIAYLNGPTWRVAFSTGSGYTSGVDTGISGQPFAGRFVPSQKDGFLVNSGGTWVYVAYNGTSFTTTSTGAAASGSVIITDQNGDGLQDLVWATVNGSTARIDLRLNTTSGAATVPTFSSTVTQPFVTGLGPFGGAFHIIPVTTCPTERLCDINGDGAADLTIVLVTTFNCSGGPGGCSPMTSGYDLISNGSSYFLANGTPGSVTPYLGFRFNDDACMDSVKFSSTQLRLSRCSTGAGTTTVTIPAPPIGAMDWDGDGRTDVLVNNGGNIGAYRSTGSQTTPFSSLVTSSIPYDSNCTYFAVDVEGDGLDELACASSSGFVYYSHSGGGSVGSPGGANVFATQMPDLATSFSDGYGVVISPAYVSTAQSNYTPGTGTLYPLADVTDPLIVVGRMRVAESVGAARDFTYTYKGARRNSTQGAPPTIPGIIPARVQLLAGPGGQAAGFEEISVVDGGNGTRQTTIYEQLFPLTGMIKDTKSLQPDGTTISSTAFLNLLHPLDGTLNNKRFFPYVSEVTTDTREVGGSLNGQVVTSTKRTLGYTDFTYGNVATDTTVVTDKDAASVPSLNNYTWTTAVTNTYDSALTSGTDWCVGFLMQVDAAKSSTAPGVGGVTQSVSFTRDPSAPAKCRTKIRTTQPSNPQYRVTETFDFDSYGNVSSIQVVGREPAPGGGLRDMTARTTQIDWGATGQFPTVVTDPSGAATTYAYNLETSTLKDVFDPNSTSGNVIKTSYLYDTFGRKTRETRPDGTYSTWDYRDCALLGCIGTTHRLSIQQTERDSVGTLITDGFVYLDTMDRTLVTRSRLLNGDTWDSSYQWSEVQYDALGRVAYQYMPCVTASSTFSCRSNAVANTYDLIGRLKSSSRPRTQGDPAVQTTEYAFAGRTNIVTDPQLKTSARVLNVDSTVRRILDANNYAVNFTYDAAGSLMGVVDSQGVTKLSEVQMAYGIAPFQVAARDSAMGLYSRNYNSLGELIGGTDAKGQSFIATYDSLSRPLTRLEPDAANQITWEWGNDPGARNRGRLRHVESSSGGETYSETLSYDTRARPSRRSISIPGQGTFVYDMTYEASKGWLDTLTYPEIAIGNRLALKFGYQNGILQSVYNLTTPSLVYWKANASNSWGNTIQETMGNGVITTRSVDAVTGWLTSITSGPSANPTGIQNLSFLHDLVGNVIQRAKPGLTENFYYGGGGDNLYRLSSSTLNNGQTTTPNLTLTYDLSGNIITRNEPGLPSLVPQTITWTPYNYPASITVGNQNATFAYGPDRQRWRMVFNDGVNPAETTYYIGGLLEKVVIGGNSTFRHSIPGNSGVVAIDTRTATTSVLRYVLGDHQGSTETFVESGTGTVTNSSFTAFGERRNAATWAGPPDNRAALDAITRQGFTYQTVLGSMGMNHMNGRVQDAIAGRFLSPDPHIPQPLYTQSYNRYAYVFNNPVTFTDPSGFSPCGYWTSTMIFENPGSLGGVGYVAATHAWVPMTCSWDNSYPTPLTPGGLAAPSFDIAGDLNRLKMPNFSSDEEPLDANPCKLLQQLMELKQAERDFAELLDKLGLTADAFEALYEQLQTLPADAKVVGVSVQGTWVIQSGNTVTVTSMRLQVLGYGESVSVSYLRNAAGNVARYAGWLGNFADAVQIGWLVYQSRWLDAGFATMDAAMVTWAGRSRNPWAIGGALALDSVGGTKKLAELKLMGAMAEACASGGMR